MKRKRNPCRRGRHARRGRARNPRRPSLRSAIYTRKQRVRGWTVPINVTWDPTAGGKMLKQRLVGWTKADHLKAAADALRKADAMGRQWNKVVNQAAHATWGRGYQIGDYQVSGIASNEFSTTFKDRLRKLAQDASALKSIAYAHQKAAGKRHVGVNSRRRGR